MTRLVLDVRAGATAGALLGALVEAGGSLERIEAAVGTLGRGPVRLSVRGGGDGTVVRVFAPEGAPDAPDWRGLRPRIQHLAADEDVVLLALATLDELMQARGRVHGVAAEDVDVDPLGGPDDLAGAVALAAAVRSLHADQVQVSTVGHGQGVLSTLEGEVQLPGPVVEALLSGMATTSHPVVAELVDPLGAAFLRALVGDRTTTPDHDVDAQADDGPTGRGRLRDDHMVLATVVHTVLAPG